ncbi:DUF4003 family protein [Jeotgalibacillus sp. S-D1]|uniref:DUF4003 family protein n=1 Tax=Jeotgalibacillus sp. S-D1 TaxID=2552189 RepID=UPI001059A2BB|nr:DUF4003 family protein [Jeotgalibacillus sp. S-D1]TDL31455.1 DUF4003 family protein [Jeotgalibacillus sp. S-D1]
MEQNEKVKELVDYYEAMRKKYKWRADNGALMMIASQYVGSSQAFNMEKYIELVEFIKQESSAFSYIQSTLRFTLAGLLLNQPADPKEAFKEIQQCYDLLIGVGFQRSPHSYIAAYALFMGKNDDEDFTVHVKRAKEMYNGMKKQHFFLTSHEDYPLAVLLAEAEGESSQLLEDMTYYYDELHLVLWKGNNRQFLSQILTYGKHENRQFLIQNTLTWMDDLKVQGFKLRGLHLPIVGVLSLISTPSRLLPKIKDLYEEMISISKFKWYKDHCFMIAVRMVVQDEINENRMLDVGLATTVESILQAQQAAVIATMSAATAASSSQGG